MAGCLWGIWGPLPEDLAAGRAPLTWVPSPVPIPPSPPSLEVWVDVDVVHLLHGAQVAAVAHGHVAVYTVEADGVRLVQLPLLVAFSPLHLPANDGASLQGCDLWEGQGSSTGVWREHHGRRDTHRHAARGTTSPLSSALSPPPAWGGHVGALAPTRLSEQRGWGGERGLRCQWAQCTGNAPLHHGAWTRAVLSAGPLTVSRYSFSGMACTSSMTLCVSSSRVSFSRSRDTSLLLALARTEYRLFLARARPLACANGDAQSGHA